MTIIFEGFFFPRSEAARRAVGIDDHEIATWTVSVFSLPFSRCAILHDPHLFSFDPDYRAVFSSAI